MINYETYCQIRLYHRERGLTFVQIARELSLHPDTVAKYVRTESYAPARPRSKRRSNLKTGVLSHPIGERATFHPRYLDFAAHYGFSPSACNVRKANEKGRVENGVGYVKKNFLAGLELPPGLSALNTAARHWMDSIANVLEQRERLARTPGPLHLTRRADLLEVELGPADLSLYEPPTT